MAADKQPSTAPLVGLAFFGFVLIGGLGGALGVLLPSQIAYYHVNKSIIGLLFFTFSIGYLFSAVSAGLLTQKIGQRGYLMGGSAIFLVSTFAFGLRPFFILALATNLFLGFGTAIIDAGFNASLAALPGRTKLLNYLHAFYGTGALLGPLVASALLAMQLEWNTVYLVWCGLSLPLLIGIVVCLRSRSFGVSVDSIEHRHGGSVVVGAFKLGAVRLGMLFLFLYVGIEIGLGNWSYSFLLEERHQGTLFAGWIVSGYWLGLTLGRFIMNTIAERFHLGTTRMVYCCLAGIGIGSLVVWLFPGVQIATLGFFLIGFFLGPIFPSTIAMLPHLIPGRFVPSAIGLIIGVSLLGGALFTWLVGTLAQSVGIGVLLPCTLAVAAVMCSNWWAMTRQLAAPQP